MTNIIGGFYDDKCYLEISGHACREYDGEYGMPEETEGNPLVCAAISVLVMTALEKIKTFERDGAFICSSVTVESGYALFNFEVREEFSEEVRHCLETLMLGFELLEENYPDYISIA